MKNYEAIQVSEDPQITINVTFRAENVEDAIDKMIEHPFSKAWQPDQQVDLYEERDGVWVNVSSFATFNYSDCPD